MDLLVIIGGVQRLSECKKLQVVNDDWTRVKEFLGWIIDTGVGTAALQERKLWKLLTLLDIPMTQLCIGQKDL